MVEIRNATPWDHLRFVISALILLFSIVVTSYAIVMEKTSFFKGCPGYVALLLFILDLILLGIVEGLQIALVELKRQHPDSYKHTHPGAYKLGQTAARGDNVERFLMGRQVCVVVLVFFAAKLTTIHATTADKGAFLFPVPGWAQAAFFETGLVACVTVVILAQLLPQIVAAKYPVHFLQFVIMKPAYYFCIFLEITGLTHICWVLAWLSQKAARMEDDPTTKNPVREEDINDNEPNTTLDQLHDSFQNVGAAENGQCAPGEVSEMKRLHDKDMLSGQFSKFTDLVARLSKNVDQDTLRVLSQYLDTHPEKFSKFPTVIGNKMYPAPGALARCFEDDELPVPRFLKDISDPEHIPPHIVACELLARNRQLQQEINLLNAKLRV